MRRADVPSPIDEVADAVPEPALDDDLAVLLDGLARPEPRVDAACAAQRRGHLFARVADSASSIRCSARRGVVRSVSSAFRPESANSPMVTTGSAGEAGGLEAAGAADAVDFAVSRPAVPGPSSRSRSMPFASRVTFRLRPPASIFAMEARRERPRCTGRRI